MTKLVHREIILAALEATYNTDANPVPATNSVLVQGLSWQKAGLKMAKRPAVRLSIGTLQDIYAGSLHEISFECEIKGSGTAGTAPEIDALLQSCALSSTVVAATSVTYAPVSTPTSQKSCTIYYYEDGSLYKVTGCRGTAAFTLKAGDVAKVKFTMTGHFESMTDVAMVTPVYQSTVPPACLNVPITLGAYSPVLDNFTLDLKNKVDHIESVTAVDGYGPVLVVERDVSGSMDPEADIVANYPAHADLLAGTTIAVSGVTLGSVAGNKAAFSMPACYIKSIKPAAKNGIRTYTLDYAAVESGGVFDNEFSLAFT